jgi:aspartate/methionine/tyrosine aminotransferase
VLLVNAPNNPTGWTLTRAEQQAILAHCRRTGTWIIADEVYERVYFAPGADCAPSFLDVAEPDDRLVVAHSFSKSFLMTGWRLGWLVLPPALVPAMGKLIEFNTSCAPVFVQRAGLAGLAGAADFVPGLIGRLKHCRDTLLPQLQALPGVQVATPDGGMYAFFRIDGHDDSLALAKRLVVEAGLGLAPGAAFGDEAEGWLRWCFASRDPSRLTQGVGRLKSFFGL